MKLKNCPDCAGELGKGAMKCRCGWKASSPQEAVNGRPSCPCVADPSCRFPGLMWIRTLNPDQRICVEHYYEAIFKSSDLAREEINPPSLRMRGVPAKAVAGE